jgi:transposase
MQSKHDQSQTAMMILPSLEAFVPADDRLRRLNRVLDLRFVHDAVRDRYCQDNGRPSIDPEVVIRLFVLQAFEGIVSVRELMRQVHLNLAYRWFIGYEVTETVPDHSTLSRALDRLGDALFNELFSRSISQCQSAGLIDGGVVHLDATVIRADLDACRVRHPQSADPEARFGRGPGGRKVPAYKQQTVVDGASRVIVGVEVTPGDAPDQVNATAVVDQAGVHLGRAPEAVCADSGYATGANREALETRGIRLVSPPPPRSQRTSANTFPVDAFVYDQSRDSFRCPAGQELCFVGITTTERRQRHRRRRVYRAARGVCQACSLRGRCTKSAQRTLRITPHHRALLDLEHDATTSSFKALYRARAPVIEGVFAEAKQWHGLRRAWRRGLSNMRTQCHLIAAVLNFKRLAAALGPLRRCWWALVRLLKASLAPPGVDSEHPCTQIQITPTPAHPDRIAW